MGKIQVKIFIVFLTCAEHNFEPGFFNLLEGGSYGKNNFTMRAFMQ
jgi:hypothetical protein